MGHTLKDLLEGITFACSIAAICLSIATIWNLS